MTRPPNVAINALIQNVCGVRDAHQSFGELFLRDASCLALPQPRLALPEWLRRERQRVLLHPASAAARAPPAFGPSPWLCSSFFARQAPRVSPSRSI
eukprot:scaffold1320_cov253-Pinguiococcus_pyrenoidosus.AAC.18